MSVYFTKLSAKALAATDNKLNEFMITKLALDTPVSRAAANPVPLTKPLTAPDTEGENLDISLDELATAFAKLENESLKSLVVFLVVSFTFVCKSFRDFILFFNCVN